MADSGLTRRTLLLGATAGVGALIGRQCLAPTNDPGPLFPATAGPEAGSATVLNDASELSPTRVASHLTITDAPDAATAQLRAALADARAAKRPFVASAARHSMGGQSLGAGGTAATLHQQWLEADTGRRTYRVAAGTRWSTVIARLDAMGFSPAVMQSNNDFGVASTFAVNAHGWPVPFSGCGSTVRRLTMLLADGSAVTCSCSTSRCASSTPMGTACSRTRRSRGSRPCCSSRRRKPSAARPTWLA